MTYSAMEKKTRSARSQPNQDHGSFLIEQHAAGATAFRSAAAPSTGVQSTVSCRVRLLEYNRALQDDDRMTLRQCPTRV